MSTVEYLVPEEVSEVVDLIHPTTFFGRTEAWDTQATTEAHDKHWIPLISWLVPVLLGTEGHSKRYVGPSKPLKIKDSSPRPYKRQAWDDAVKSS